MVGVCAVNLITVIVALILVIILSFLLYCAGQILTIWDSEMNESTNKLRAEVEAAKQKLEEVRAELAEFHRKGDE